MSNAEQDYYAEIVELRAELERMAAERDAARAAAGAWKRKAKWWREVAADEVSYGAGFTISPVELYSHRQNEIRYRGSAWQGGGDD